MAISIPVFTSQLEKSRESTDAANIRAAYAEVMAASLTQDDTNTATGLTRSGAEGSFVWSKNVTKTQTQKGWQNDTIKDVGGIQVDADAASTVTDGSKVTAVKLSGWTITYTQSTGKCTIIEQ